MRFIPTVVHGVLDYLMGFALIVLPWTLGLSRDGAETWVPLIVGTAVMSYSLITRYELGLLPLVSMRQHLWLDALGGLLLAFSPWIFGFAGLVYLPHLVVGLAEFSAALFTETEPSVESARQEVRKAAQAGSATRTGPAGFTRGEEEAAGEIDVSEPIRQRDRDLLQP